VQLRSLHQRVWRPPREASLDPRPDQGSQREAGLNRERSKVATTAESERGTQPWDHTVERHGGGAEDVRSIQHAVLYGEESIQVCLWRASSPSQASSPQVPEQRRRAPCSEAHQFLRQPAHREESVVLSRAGRTGGKRGWSCLARVDDRHQVSRRRGVPARRRLGKHALALRIGGSLGSASLRKWPARDDPKRVPVG